MTPPAPARIGSKTPLLTNGLRPHCTDRLRSFKPCLRELLHGSVHADPATKSARGLTRVDAAPANGNFKTDPNAPFAHPFFWAPFILMGNWL